MDSGKQGQLTVITKKVLKMEAPETAMRPYAGIFDAAHTQLPSRLSRISSLIWDGGYEVEIINAGLACVEQR